MSTVISGSVSKFRSIQSIQSCGMQKNVGGNNNSMICLSNARGSRKRVDVNKNSSISPIKSGGIGEHVDWLDDPIVCDGDLVTC